jgi:hypothetical protein
VLAVRARLVVPSAPSGPGPTIERVRQLQLDRQTLEDRRVSLAARRATLAGVALQPGLARKSRVTDPVARVGDALAASALITERLTALDAELGALEFENERLAREIERAELAAAQARSHDRFGEGHPTMQLTVHLAEGSGVPSRLEVEYAVAPARWWPAYTARFSAGATRVGLSLDAFVAQASGEDWTHVALSLTTADLVSDARLPELSSLRLGRAQPASRRGYRPPPGDTDALFAGFRRASERYAASKHPAAFGVLSAHDTRSTETLAPMGGAVPFQAGVAGAPPAAPIPLAQPMPMSIAATAPALRAKSANPLGALGDLLDLAGGAAMPRSFEAQESAAIEPEDTWLDFDAISVAGIDDAAHLGKLVKQNAPGETAAVRSARAVIEMLDAPAGAPDPRETRGQFDHRYHAEGRTEIPSDATSHRVTLSASDAYANTRFRAVPRSTLDVFREAEIKNPFSAPLLGGPVDVFIEGALTTTTAMPPVDRGGVITVGIGIEDRVRIARNAQVAETSSGLLGGTVAIDHAVAIDLVSSLGRPIAVDVVERIPVSDDRDVEVSVLAAKPRFEKYEQVERGAPIRRGVRWTVEIPPGGSTRIEFGYRVSLPAKSEVVGGNRRE